MRYEMYFISYVYRKCGLIVEFRPFEGSKIKFQEIWFIQP